MTLFPVTTVGSWPRPPELLRMQKLWRTGRLPEEDFQAFADRCVLDCLRLQERLGVDLVTDGEQRRDNFYSFVAHGIEGTRLMTLAEILDHIEDKESFEQVLQTLDVPAYSLSTPACVGPIRRRRPLAADELRFLKRHTDLPVKVPLPGPYLLTRAMYVQELTGSVYGSKEALGDDVVRVLREELSELVAEGAEFVQFDEPVLTEIVFTPTRTRTFMCASLAASGDPTEELGFAVDLMNRVLEGIPRPGTTVGVHVCRGNWSQDESILLRGSYHPLQPWLERMNVDQLVLEYATERAGEILAFGRQSLGLGVVNPRSERVESPSEIVRRVEAALSLYPPDRLYLNPDCGFGTFSNSPVNSGEVAAEKIGSMVSAARTLRATYGGEP